jgi:NitT/TauT family transport system substrate-binding protein
MNSGSPLRFAAQRLGKTCRIGTAIAWIIGRLSCSPEVPIMNPIKSLRAGALGLLIAAWSCSGSASAAEKVSVRLNWIPGAEHGFLYLAKQKGWFSEAGIDLEIIAGQGSTVVVKTVGNGETEFGMADGATIARGWETGVPLVSTAVLLKESPASIYSPKSAGIATIQDICSKRIGANIKSTTYAQYQAMVRLANLKDCKYEEVPTAAGGIKEVLAHLVDGAVTYAYEDPLMLEVQGIPVNQILAKDFFKLYSIALVTNQTMASTKPDLVARFISVTLRGLKYTVAHPEEAVDAYARISPSANLAYEKVKLAYFNRMLISDDPAGDKIGQQTAAGWDASLDTLVKIGIVTKKMDSAGKFIPLPE